MECLEQICNDNDLKPYPHKDLICRGKNKWIISIRQITPVCVNATNINNNSIINCCYFGFPEIISTLEVSVFLLSDTVTLNRIFIIAHWQNSRATYVLPLFIFSSRSMVILVFFPLPLSANICNALALSALFNKSAKICL